MGRQPTAFNKVPTGDDVIDRLQDRLVEAFRLVMANTLFAAGSFRLNEVTVSGALRFALQYRNGFGQWSTVGHFDSAGVYTAGS